jgi:ABC-type dipeptide/oligopeptide/nickel transport system permease subunit
VRLGFIGFGDQVQAPDLGGSCVISSDPVSSFGSWRIFFCPSLFSVGAGIDVISPAASSGGMSYQPGKPDWSLVYTFFWWFLFPPGCIVVR